jgi:hypothetical protein
MKVNCSSGAMAVTVENGKKYIFGINARKKENLKILGGREGGERWRKKRGRTGMEER